MKPQTDTPVPFRISLISMPWSIFNRPSLQLSVLKAYLEREMTAIQVDLCHPYLELAGTLGFDTYRRISESGWAGEALFAALLFPSQRQQAAKVFGQSLKRKGPRRTIPDFQTLIPLIEASCRSWLDRIDFEKVRLAGFSVCFNQLFSSLYAAALLKNRHPELPIVFGGSSCASELGISLLHNFPQIDYVVDGEGEGPLLGLCTSLAGDHSPLPARLHSRIPGLTRPSPEITDLSLLPMPEYSGYFSEMRHLFPSQPFIPVLPLEFSRGCWWNKCTFCNLNIQWQGYRSKKATQVMAEVDSLVATHQCLDFTFSDNALPIREADTFFQQQTEHAADCRFFAEIRGITDFERLSAYSRGGLKTIQVGIEALSTSLLAKMAKGLSTIENIAVMKHSAAAGIRLEGNLILEFPGSDENEVMETLAALDYVLPFSPLSPAVFFLGFGSPVHRNPERFGIGTFISHSRNRFLPTELLTNLTMLTLDYRGGHRKQRRLWRPVADKIKSWRQFHDQRKSRQPPLSYRDGGSFLIIRQERLNDPPLQHRLRGLSRKIYLFCEQIRTRNEIASQFQSLTPRALDDFLSDLTAKRLLFQENGSVIALAIPSR